MLYLNYSDIFRLQYSGQFNEILIYPVQHPAIQLVNNNIVYVRYVQERRLTTKKSKFGFPWFLNEKTYAESNSVSPRYPRSIFTSILTKNVNKFFIEKMISLIKYDLLKN